jgi:surface carbohydrate biosynthesis protein
MNIRIRLFNNKKADIILLDDNYANLKFEKYTYEVVKFNNIYINYVLLSFIYTVLNFKNLSYFKKKYLKILLNSFDSKIAIGHHINGLAYYYKSFFPNNKAITYQLCRESDFGMSLIFNQNFIKPIQSDYFIVYDKRHLNLFSKYVSSNYIIAGSVKNNEIELKKEIKIYDIMLISEYRGLDENNYFSMINKFIAKKIGEYCLLNNKKFVIALSSHRKDKRNKLCIEKEKSFFKSVCSNVIFPDIKYNSYEVANISKLIVCNDSNLGIELLSRKQKVLFLPFYGYFSEQYHFELFSEYEGYFWTRNINNIYTKIKSLLEIDEKEWECILEDSAKLIPFDSNNIILKNLVKTLNN